MNGSEPSVPGVDIVGEIHAVGDEVTNGGIFRKGDRVAALTNGGGNAKYISILASSLIQLQPTSTHQNIICLVTTYMTAYQSLKLAKKQGAPLTNASVLITGGSGPVGQALVDLATREGAKVYATAHKMHCDHLTSLGAKWFPIRPNKWLPTLQGKMDVVIDSLCIDGYESSYQALAPEGTLICTGNTSVLTKTDEDGFDTAYCHIVDTSHMSTWWLNIRAKYMWDRTLFYDLRESFENDPQMFRQELQYLICMLEKNEIKPKIAGQVALNQVPKAQKLLEKGLPNGTIVCLPWKRLDPKQNVAMERHLKAPNSDYSEEIVGITC